MRGIFTKKWSNLIVLSVICAGALLGCGYRNNATVTNYTGSALQNSSQDTGEVENQEAQTEAEPEALELYIVENLDMTDETIALYSIDSDQQLRYKYNMTTKFLNKYGSTDTWAEFTTGTVVSIGDFLPASGALSQVQKSADVWMYEDISKYSIDASRNLITIDGKNYKITDKTKVYSDSAKILLENIGKDDAITVTGKDKEVLSIAITTGHGFISLVNTSVFDGSLIFIGNKIVSMVNGNETIEVPEGTYLVTVANNGWGGSQEITVNRDENILVDLDLMKGDGPSYCLMTFLVTVPETYVYIDGKIVDTNEPQYVQYGSHKLVVKCSGYKAWRKTLVVNSETAEITLAMEAETESGTTTNETSNETASEASEQAQEIIDETVANGPEEETAGSSIKSDYDYEVDYLSTISDLISNLMN
ncbi:hypothetical protein [Pseudobutyrivibrio xylanivorans]|uniref:PEGA domain-containing protein n=1 Tax=Pseudobutyrivibrio xylanivorans TaxID=185007 RepID=A0A1G5RRY3_PSEXY|nr:hypothetical protein [Pseudobutyrivibrio xylanivorans]SCZ76191.1 hypothetical protein SAMN02910350_00126 [Pseudobutyrivibrio xylanivorans]